MQSPNDQNILFKHDNENKAGFSAVDSISACAGRIQGVGLKRRIVEKELQGLAEKGEVG